MEQIIPKKADSNPLSTETADIHTSSLHLEDDVYFPSGCAAAAALTERPTSHSIWRTAETELLEQPSIVPPISMPETSSTPFSALVEHQPRFSPFTSGEPPSARSSTISGAGIDAGYQVVDVGQAATRPVLQPVLQLPSNIASPFYYIQVPVPVVTPSIRGNGENTAISNPLDAEDYQLVDPTEIPGYVGAARAVTSSETLHLDVGPNNVTGNDPVQGLYHWNKRTVEVPRVSHRARKKAYRALLLSQFFEIASRYDGEFPSRQANPNWQRETTEWSLNMYYLLNAMGPRERRLSDIVCPPDIRSRMVLQNLGFPAGESRIRSFGDRYSEMMNWTIFPVLMPSRCTYCRANARICYFTNPELRPVKCRQCTLARASCSNQDTPFNNNGSTSISTNRKQLAETLHDIAGRLDTGPPDKATRDLMTDTLYSAWSLSV